MRVVMEAMVVFLVVGRVGAHDRGGGGARGGDGGGGLGCSRGISFSKLYTELFNS